MQFPYHYLWNNSLRVERLVCSAIYAVNVIFHAINSGVGSWVYSEFLNNTKLDPLKHSSPHPILRNKTGIIWLTLRLLCYNTV
jgi:hypothetical protein